MEALLLAALSAVAGLLGGWLALSRRVKPDLAYSFTAGALIGLAAFSLLPQIIELSGEASLSLTAAMGFLVAGFLSIHIIEKLVSVHHNDDSHYRTHTHPFVGLASAAALIGHSFLDGMSIGVAFQISKGFGLTVAVAVIGHRLADGFNIANLVKKSGGRRSRIFRLVVAGALAPVFGVILANFVEVSVDVLMAYFGLFAGLILYIGASEILPQAHSRSVGRSSLFLTLGGVLLMYIISHAI